jgi:hypothetical protein
MALPLALTACIPPAQVYLDRYGSAQPAPADFTVCHGYGCHYVTAVSLTPAELESVHQAFAVPAPDAAAERQEIGAAIVEMQRLVGLRNGTFRHQTRATFNLGDPTQLDCIDETVDTVTFLRIFEREGWLHWYDIGPTATRGTLLTRDFENAATIVERGTGATFAVDAQLADAGEPPAIVTMSLWRSGWCPQTAAACANS